MRSAFNPMGVTDMAKDYIIDYGNNSNGYYRKWKSGFIEQWNTQSYVNSGTVINFPLSFKDTNYTIVISGTNSYNYYDNKTSTSVTLLSNASGQRSYYACGF